MDHTYSQLRNRNAGVRLTALKSLGRVSLDAHVLQLLPHLLHDAEPAVRLEAARSLGQIGNSVVSLLVDTVSRHEDPGVRREAALSLGKLSGEAAVIPALAAALKDGDVRVRISAAMALGDHGAAAGPAVPALVAALEGTNLILGRLAAQALSRIGRPAVAALTGALHSADKSVRREAAWALGQIGPEAREAIPALRELLHDLATSASLTQVAAPRKAPSSEVTCVVDVVPLGGAHRTQVTDCAPAFPENDARVREAAALALERIQGMDRPVPGGLASSGTAAPAWFLLPDPFRRTMP